MQPQSRTPLTFSPDQPEHPGKLRQDALSLLASVRSTLSDLLDQVRAGDAGALGDLVAKHSELETALKRSFETEKRYDDWQAKQGGAPTDVTQIDFDALRRDIACRLVRLRECCQDD